MGQDGGAAHVGVGVKFCAQGRPQPAPRCGGGGRAIALAPSASATVVEGSLCRGCGDNARGPRPRTKIRPAVELEGKASVQPAPAAVVWTALVRTRWMAP
jgi:hypothetical protein